MFNLDHGAEIAADALAASTEAYWADRGHHRLMAAAKLRAEANRTRKIGRALPMSDDRRGSYLHMAALLKRAAQIIERRNEV